MQRIDYHKELERIVAECAGQEKSLLLHACCAPCSSYCLEYLREHFSVTVFYFNPNITEREEYEKRAAEEKKLIEIYNRQIREGDFEGMRSSPGARKIGVLEGEYNPQDFYDIAKGFEQCPEGEERCMRCYELRLRKTAETAARGGYDFFTTTLSISPLKNAQKLNEIGAGLAAEYGVPYLYSDFKKRGGYQRSIELSGKFGLYRQDYCGCVYSKAQREREKNAKDREKNAGKSGKNAKNREKTTGECAKNGKTAERNGERKRTEIRRGRAADTERQDIET